MMLAGGHPGGEMAGPTSGLPRPESSAASSRKPTRAKALGVSDDEYARLLASQGGGCAICGARPKTRRLHADHDHATGRVRGLLCHRCNRNLPAWVTAQWLQDAAMYLAGWTCETSTTGETFYTREPA